MIIKRARGHRLYTNGGDKIIDLSMDEGRAVLGHRPNGLSLTIKNVIERGLYAPYDNIYIKRLTKELSVRFPDHTNVRVVKYEEKITSLLNTPALDPLFTDCTGAKLAYWRPFLEIPDADNIIVLYPLPGLNTVAVVVSRESLELESDMISPVLLSGILRSLYDYDLILKKFNPRDYSKFKDVTGGVLKAPYLILNREIEEYSKICEKAEEEGIMLNGRAQIAVLAPDFSHGEQQKILNLFK